jgi:hypothetical protein
MRRLEEVELGDGVFGIVEPGVYPPEIQTSKEIHK